MDVGQFLDTAVWRDTGTAACHIAVQRTRAFLSLGVAAFLLTATASGAKCSRIITASDKGREEEKYIQFPRGLFKNATSCTLYQVGFDLL